uniref:Uncharacterized protein n=1 Tax=Oryza rufipogon TaxID=4529 RepID=A0A0E0QF48_ORYRU
MLHEQRVHSIDIKGYGSARRQCSLPRHHFPMRCLRSPPLCHPPASLPNPDKESQEVGHTALVAQAIPCRQATTSILQWSSPQRRGGCPQREGVAWPTSKETSHRPPQVCCHPPWPDDDEGLPLLLAISGCPQLLRRLPRRRRHLARCQDHRSPPLPAAPPASALAGRPRLLPPPPPPPPLPPTGHVDAGHPLSPPLPPRASPVVADAVAATALRLPRPIWPLGGQIHLRRGRIRLRRGQIRPAVAIPQPDAGLVAFTAVALGGSSGRPRRREAKSPAAAVLAAAQLCRWPLKRRRGGGGRWVRGGGRSSLPPEQPRGRATQESMLASLISDRSSYRKAAPNGVQKSTGVSLATAKVLDIGTRHSPLPVRSLLLAAVASPPPPPSLSTPVEF